ncbi:MAG: hypothetical protein ACJ79B_04010 [Gemmatimonadaceae bacterium]
MTQTDRRPPAELEEAMERALAGVPSPTALDVLDAAERLLGNVLRTGCETRASALDLLTVDALMTRALEIAARDATLLETFPEQAMQRIASMGEARPLPPAAPPTAPSR